MVVKFLYPRWGAAHVPWSIFLDQAAAAGYAGVEWFPYGEQATVETILSQVQELKAREMTYTLVMTVVGEWDDFEGYCTLLTQQLIELCLLTRAYKPRFISAQVGREYFTNNQIIDCLELCNRIAQEQGIEILQETHRNKWSYGLHRVVEVLESYAEVSFTLDLSHWFCISESYLEDRVEQVCKILAKTKHIHARIGSTQSAQVHDVRLEQFEPAVKAHWAFWKRWLELMKAKGEEEVTITTEFGPPPYSLALLNQDRDYAFQWEQNSWIKNYLNEEINKIYDIA